MSKGVYFFFQMFWSIIVASVVWYFYPASGTFDFSLTGDFKEAGLYFIGGAVLYLIFTIVHIIIGRETIRNWSMAIAVVTIIIAVIVFVLGRFTEQFAVQMINSTLDLGLFIRL